MNPPLQFFLYIAPEWGGKQKTSSFFPTGGARDFYSYSPLKL
ncbi:hypothetical protein PL11201_410041 [Planktothrix sp. PCC 11201]|nr:hypothetical protein PL11201_410041 [Planktothrix sp. PCC 11201]